MYGYFQIPEIIILKICLHKMLNNIFTNLFLKNIITFSAETDCGKQIWQSNFLSHVSSYVKNPIDQILIKMYTFSHLHFFWEGLDWIRKSALSDPITHSCFLRKKEKMSKCQKLKNYSTFRKILSKISKCNTFIYIFMICENVNADIFFAKIKSLLQAYYNHMSMVAWFCDLPTHL